MSHQARSAARPQDPGHSAEERFDRVTRLCQRIFKADSAVVSLVDKDRQWFKSAQGVDAKETPRNISFCGHAILQDALMVVPDALLDERFVDNPLVVNAPHIRFYAGMPLKASGGHRLGTLCIFGTHPRRLTTEDTELLKDLAAIVEEELNHVELNEAMTRLQETESRLEDFLENVGDLIMMASVEEGPEGSDGRIIYANRAWKERFGYDDKDLKTVRIKNIFHEHDRERRELILARLKTGESIQGLVMDFVTKDGQTFPAEGTVSLRFKDGKVLYSRIILRDVTERRKIEQLKNEAVSLASHELRQPLAVIRTALDAVGQYGQTIPAAKTQEFLQMASRNADRLMDMVNLYLDLAKLESGDMQIKREPVKLAAVIERVVTDVGVTAAARGVRLEIKAAEADVTVAAEPGRLVQVLTNLLSNAVKFSPKGEAITVSWARQDGEASVAVADHGPGISPEFRTRIFGKFAQDRKIETSREIKGTGLGLSIAKAIVERLGARSASRPKWTRARPSVLLCRYGASPPFRSRLEPRRRPRAGRRRWSRRRAGCTGRSRGLPPQRSSRTSLTRKRADGLENSFSNSAKGLPPLICPANSSMPAECVGPGRTALTVTAVPAHVSARPRETASWAVLVIP